MPDIDRNLAEFSISVYGAEEPFSDVITRRRVRIFYRGRNRNGSYITDEFAEKLIQTLPYTPVKGIYDTEDGDYTDHGSSRNLGRIYGIVPEDPNFAWEKHVDDDGVEREYACADVLLFTALYTEANVIMDKAQSMELYLPSIKGDWEIRENQRVFVFQDACFLGLQVLGDDVEPCFEGAAFFTLYDSLTNMIKKLEDYTANFQNNVHVEGEREMPNFKISDNQKFSMLWTLLNPNYTEEGGYVIEYGICDIYDDYAVAFNYADGTYQRVYYTKNDETDSLSIDRTEQCFIVDINKSEKDALDALHAMHQDTYEKIDEDYKNLTEKVSEYELKIEEFESTVSTLNTEKDNAIAQYTEANTLLTEAKESLETAQASITSLTTERDELFAFKEEVELKAKQAVIDSYAEVLDKAVLDQYTEKIAEFTAEDLDKELAYELKKTNPSVFKKTDNNPTYIPTDNHALTGVEEILSKYANK